MSLRGAPASGGLERLHRGLWAAVFLAWPVVLCGWSPEAVAQTGPSPEDMEKARRHMQAGAAFYNDPGGAKCEEALVEFTKAHELSGSTKALRAMGVCALELERDAEAIAHFEAFLAAAKDAKPADRKQVESDLAALKSALAKVTFESDVVPARLVAVRTPTQGSTITNRYDLTAPSTTLGLHPGAYDFTASSDGHPDVRFHQEVPHGGVVTRPIAFRVPETTAPPAAPDEEETSRPIPPTAIVFGGLALALTVPAVVFGVSALDAGSDFDERNGKAPRAELEEMHDDVIVKSALADGFAIGAIASAAVATVFFLTRPEVRRDETEVGVVVTGQTQGLVVTTSF